MGNQTSEGQSIQPVLPLSKAAEPFGFHHNQLRRAIRKGELRAFRIGGWLRVRIEDVESWVEGQEFVPQDDSSSDGGRSEMER